MINNYLITGIPRSGTTLLTSLLSKSCATVFSEPSWLKEVRREGVTPEEFSKCFIKKLNSLRDDLQKRKPILLKVSKFYKGQPSNYYVRNTAGEIINDKEELPTLLNPKAYNQPFIIKSNAQFTACLTELIKFRRVKISCVIRNPIAVIMSWRSLDIPVSHGNMKIAEQYNKDYLAFVAPAKSLLEKQVLMVDWFFAEYSKHAKRISIIKYEELVNKPNQILSQWSFYDRTMGVSLKNHNKSSNYDLSERDEIRSCFLQNANHYKAFYPSL